MSTPSKKIMKKWIDLKDANGALLKVGRFQGRLVLVIDGVRPRSATFHRVINELGFTPSKSGAYLAKALASEHEKVLASHFQKIWPNVELREMDVSNYFLNLEKLSQKHAQSVLPAEKQDSAADAESMIESIQEILNRSTYLGRNRTGERVFSGAAGRFFVNEQGDKDQIVREQPGIAISSFLRGNTQSEVRDCAAGLLRACEKGESQQKESLLRFAGAVLQKEVDAISSDELNLIAQTIDSAILQSLVDNNVTAGSAWADAAYYQEMMPGRAALVPDSVETPYLPVPIAVQAQRFLTSAGAVLINGKIPGFGFGLLPENTLVFVEEQSIEWSNESFHRPIVERIQNQDVPADGAYWRISGDQSPDAFDNFFSSQTDDATSVITAGSLDVADSIRARARVVQAIKVPSWLANTAKPIFMFIVKKGDIESDVDRAVELTPAQITSWDDLKTIADETLLRLGKEQEAREAIRSESSRSENRYQRPYLAFSKTGVASTMVPKNLQAALGFALSRLEDTHGPIDQFVSSELGVGEETLAKQNSPEQIDAIALAVNRIQEGRGFILGDETGIGKGRTLAAIATWANKQGKRVIFMTDRSNLFSDLARDLIDIGEWERFRPLITNADGKVLNIMGDAEELALPPTPGELKRIMAMDPNDVSANIIFTTYSQNNLENSEKAKWIQSLCPDSLVILDEAHIAAGSDSNIAKQAQTLADSSWGVVYSSATWAKSSKNLHIYSRALPESVNINQVITAMKEDGESFGEIFSSMLAMDGAFIRREHDLSKIDFVVDSDEEYAARNTQVAGQVSEILGMMAMVSGDINHMLQRMNSGTRNALIEARNARYAVNSAIKSDFLLRAGYATALATREEERGELLTYISSLEAADLGPFREGESNEEIAGDIPAALMALNSPDRERDAQWTNRFELATARGKLDVVLGNIAAIERTIAASGPAQPAAAATASPMQPGRMFTSSFGTGGAIYQVMRRSLAALSVDHTADKAIRSAQAGRRPVIVLEETGESFIRQFINDEIERIKFEIAELRNRKEEGGLTAADTATREIADLLDKGASLSDVVTQVRVPTIQDMMRNLLARLGGIKITEIDDSETDLDDSKIDDLPAARLVAQARIAELPGMDAETVEKYMNGIDEITAKINELPPLPISPVDALRIKMEKAGLTVGEISGRTFELQPLNKDDDWKTSSSARLTKRARKKSDVTQMVKAFNSAKVDALILNKSAATGLSVHSSPRFPDSRQRELFEMQSDENPTNRIQLFGRVNRFDQVVPPRISMMTTGLKGEMRTIMMQNRKLTGLSANIRSSRENAALISSVPDLLNKTGDKVCQEYLLENPGIAGRLDISMGRINVPYGLSHFMTQRIALLTPAHQEKVYEDLTIAYEDALLENKLALDSDTIVTRDWKAKTVLQRVAWGPTQNIESLSAFDSPVFQREVEFEQNYQPFHWSEIREKIAASTQRLLADDRVRPQHILSVADANYGEPVFQSQIDEEIRLSESQKHDLWTTGLLGSMAMCLPQESLVSDNLDLDFEDSDSEDPAAPFESAPTKRIPKGFASLAGFWVAAESRIPGTTVNQRLMALISRSGKTAKLWFLDEKGHANVYLMDLEKAILGQSESSGHTIGSALKQIGTTDGISEESWQRRRFNSVWGSIDPDVKLLDTSAAVNKAIEVMEGKKIIALPHTGFQTVEQAMSSGEHNAVKEASFRQAFMKKILLNLTPGTQVWITPKEGNQRFGSFFNARRMVVTDVKMPPAGQESVLSRWKFHLASPGEEAATVLSGALLFKLGGHAPLFGQMNVSGNLFTGMGNEIQWAAESFDRFKKGVVTRQKTLLTGNMFQAGEWARDTKKGVPIIYTDEAGQGHRAIEVANSIWGRERVSFPLRLHNRSAIKDFIERNYAASPLPVICYTSFKGVLASQRMGEQRRGQDCLVLDPRNNVMGWDVDKSDRDRIRRVLRNAIKVDKAEWEAANPGGNYPAVYSTASGKVAKNSKEQQAQLSFKLPDTVEGRDRFFDVFIKTVGMQIFVSESGSRQAYQAAQLAERGYYERLAQPAIEERERYRQLRERRQGVQSMMNDAFGATTSVIAEPAPQGLQTADLLGGDIEVATEAEVTEAELSIHDEVSLASAPNVIPLSR